MTLSLLAASLGVFGLSVFRERRGRPDWRAPIVPPWLIQFLALTVALLMAAHLVTLLTGRPFAGRLG